MQPVRLAAGDPLTGWATVGLTVVAVATLVYTVVTATRSREEADKRIQDQRDYDDQRAQRDREQADKRIQDQLEYDNQRAQRDRADGEARLEAERKAADQRLAEERAHMEKARQRERQQDSATRLLMCIADLLPLINRVPNVFNTSSFGQGPGPYRDDRAVACERAVDGLRFGGFADLPGLCDAMAAEQYAHSCIWY